MADDIESKAEECLCLSEGCEFQPFVAFTLSRLGEPDRIFKYCGMHEMHAYKALSSVAFENGYKITIEKIRREK